MNKGPSGYVCSLIPQQKGAVSGQLCDWWLLLNNIDHSKLYMILSTEKFFD